MTTTDIKRIFLLLTFLNCASYVFAQQGEWTWMHGSNLGNQNGSNGSKGVSTSSNMPRARYEGGQWTDKFGKFWMFGGACPTGYSPLNDMWKYDPTINQWVWLNGSDGNTPSQKGVYGTIGVPGTLNTPGARTCMVTWVDTSGKLWLFGGAGYGSNGVYGMLNDLWRFDPDPSSPDYNKWTWISGSDLGNPTYNFGSKGVSTSSNSPRSRYQTRASWTDNYNNLWFFGGSDNLNKRYSDMWKYDIGNNVWTWMHGDSAVGKPGFYGTKGVPDPLNNPGARWVFMEWKDQQGNFWMFGGSGFDAAGLSGRMNDLWKYDPNPSSPDYNKWTWVNGSDKIDPLPVFTGTCLPGSTIGQNFAGTGWTDACGNLVVYSGEGDDSSNVTGWLNDIWRYNIAKNEWTWINGDATINPAYSYGVQGVSSSSNKPPSRSGAHSWVDAVGNFWVFGGNTPIGVFRNDLWRYVPGAGSSTAGFSYTEANCIFSFTDTSSTNCDEIKSYSWSFNDPASGVNDTSGQVNPSHQFSSGGTFNVKLVITNCAGVKDSVVHAINFVSPPAANAGSDVTITIGDSTVLSASPSTGVTYSWTPSTGLDCTDCAAPTAKPGDTTTYYLTVKDSNGCVSTDSVTVFVIPKDTVNPIKCADIFIPDAFSPNGDGANDVLYVRGTPGCISNFMISVYDRWGETVFETNDITKGWDGISKNKDTGPAVYSYYLRATLLNKKNEQITQKGNITLVR